MRTPNGFLNPNMALAGKVASAASHESALHTSVKIVWVSLSLLLMLNGRANAQSSKNPNLVEDSLLSKSVRVISLPSNDTDYVPVLKPPISCKIRSGFVSLRSMSAGEEHSTEAYEEMIIILSGQAVLHCRDNDYTLAAGQIAYVPPFTIHQMKNTGTMTLKYLYIVTKTE